jgi:hypothetical protein
MIDKLNELKLVDGKSIRLFFCGKEMKQDEKIGSYTSEDAVITVFMR